MSISELLQNLKTNIDSMSVGEKLFGGCATAVLAMGIVFLILVLIMYIIKIINANPKVENVNTESTISNIADIEKNEDISKEDDVDELVSVITAAIMASSLNNIIVRRITRTNNIQSNWEKTSNIEV